MKLTGREKRIIVLGACLAAVVLAFYTATLWLPDRDALARDLELKKAMLIRQREMLGREDFYRARLEQFRRRLDQDMTRLLPGENPNTAGAELQKLLKDFADQSGVEINQRTIQPEKKLQDGLVKVSVKIDINCSPEQLVQFLALIENYEKFFVVDEALINSFKVQKKYDIRPSLTVSGYISPRARKPAEKPASGA